MNLDALYSELTLKTEAKMVLLVMDGLGDIAVGGLDSSTPLEAATTPNLDALTKDAAQGRMIPVAPGITPGSGPGHLALFGYDPIEFQVGRGVIEALGLGLELKSGDVAARANFCTLDPKGIVIDRRAGRIETELCEELCHLLSKRIKKIGDAQVIIKAGKGHRFVVVFRGKGLEGPLTDADPHREGFRIPRAEPVNKKSAKAKKTAKLVAEFYKVALPLLAKKKPANGFLMRGIAHQPAIPTFQERYKLRAACIAVYPMYKGLAQLVGMRKLEGAQTIQEQFERYLTEYDRRKKKGNRRSRQLAPHSLAEKTGRARDHGRSLDTVRVESTLVASATGVAHVRVHGQRQTGTLHRDGSEHRITRFVRSEIFDAIDASERAHVRQIRRVMLRR